MFDLKRVTAAALLCGGAVALVVAEPQTATQAMARAAKALIATLEPAQLEKLRFPFASEERFNWHFIPRDAPRAAAEGDDRSAAHRGVCAAQDRPQREGLHESRDDPQLRGHPARRREGTHYPRSRAVLLLDLRRSGRGDVGLAVRGTPHRAELDDRRRQGDLDVAGVPRRQSGGSAGRTAHRARGRSAPKKISRARSSPR